MLHDLVGRPGASFGHGTPSIALAAFGTFDAAGIWSVADTVPPGLSGCAATLRSYAVGFRGKLVDRQDAALVFQ